MRPAIIGPFGPAQLACLRSWKARGWQPFFIQTGERRAPSLLTRLLDGYLYLSDIIADRKRIALLAHFLAEHEITGLTCLSYEQMDWLHEIAAELPQDVALWIAPPEMLTILRSKTLQVETALAVDLPVLDSIALDKQFSGHIGEDFFPLVLRPGEESKVRPGFKMILIEDADAVTRFLASRTSIDSALIGQRFVNGPNLVVHGMRNANREHIHQGAFMVNRKFDGVSLTIEPTDLSTAIGEQCRAFVERIDYVGIYHFELLMEPSSGNYYFLEINGRLGGTTGKAFACGYDEPAHLVEAFNVTELTPAIYRPKLGNVTCTNKRGVARALLEFTRGKATLFDYPGRTSRWYLLDLIDGLFRWRDEIFLAGHIKTAVAYTLHTLMPDNSHREMDSRGSRGNGARSGASVIAPAKRSLQWLLRRLIGEYQVFHILRCSETCVGQSDDSIQQEIACTEIAEGYRFSLAGDDHKPACNCSFWTAEVSNTIRAFIPLKSKEAELVLLETYFDYRHRGLAKRLVHAASMMMLNQGFTALYARVWHSNTASMRTFYRASWSYAYTIVEIYPLGRKLRCHLKLPQGLVW